MKKSNNRWKNPWFYVGIIGVILTAIGVDGSTFTTWGVVAKGFMDFIQNPFLNFPIFNGTVGFLASRKVRLPQ